MGFKKFIKKQTKDIVQSQREKRAFLKEVAKEEKVARRESFKREAIKQAHLRGSSLARERAAPRQSMFGQFVQPQQRVAPVRRRVAVRKAPVKRKPVRRKVRRKTTKRKAPVKRRKKRTTQRVAPRRSVVDTTQDWGF